MNANGRNLQSQNSLYKENKDSVICDRHWATNFATTKIFGKKKPQYPPSVFKGVPKSSIPTPLLLQEICIVMIYHHLNQKKISIPSVL